MRGTLLLLVAALLAAPPVHADATCVGDACVTTESEGACGEDGTDHSGRNATTAGLVPRDGTSAFVVVRASCDGGSGHEGAWWTSDHRVVIVGLRDDAGRYSFAGVAWSAWQSDAGETRECRINVWGNGLFELVGERGVGCPAGGPDTLP